LLTYEPQWGSDVRAMFQSMVERRPVPRNLLTQDVPEDKQQDLDFLVDLIDWTANLDPEFKKHHYLQPIPVSDSASEGYIDKWIVYGKIEGRQKFSARELTLFPGARCVIRDAGASGAVVVQGRGRIARLQADSPALIRFGQMTQDEFFISHEAAIQGITFENLSQSDPMVILRYFGPDVHDGMPEAGSYPR